MVSTRTTENDNIEQGVGAETVGTVDGDACRLAGGVQTWDDLVVAALLCGLHQ